MQQSHARGSNRLGPAKIVSALNESENSVLRYIDFWRVEVVYFVQFALEIIG